MSLVVITGASSGVGAASAQAFARLGSKVVLVARNTEKLNALAAKIGERATVATCDAANPADVSAMAEKVFASLGIPDVVINSAGAGQWKTLPQTDTEDIRMMMDAPFLAAFFVTRAFLPSMIEQGRGTFIHVNSPACQIAWPSSVGYASSRAALRGFHEALSQDLVGTGVRSCSVIFGKISSEYFENNPGTEELMPALARTMPKLTPEKCAIHIVNLANRPRHTATYPAMLRFQLGFCRLFPSVTRWLARF